MQLQYVIRKQVSRVYLQKDGTTSIGIVLKDGAKTGSRPVIKAIKKGSIAFRSHCVSERDAIVSVCGQDARGMSRKDFKHLLREAESEIELQLEYHIQEARLSECGVYRLEQIELRLQKESESFGFVLRKFGFRHPASPGYPVISNVRKGGPAGRDGRLKAGDRLLKIDEQDLEVLSLSQVADILQTKTEATFTVEYKIALVENCQIRLGEKTNLEIDCLDADLGLVLAPSGSRMAIEKIHKGSLADRCGVFRVGDDILAINDIDIAFLSTSKANNLLRSFNKEPGRLVLVANIDRLATAKRNSCVAKEKTNLLLKEMPHESISEREQLEYSNNHSMPTCNRPQSLLNRNVTNTTRSTTGGSYSYQRESIVMLRETIKNIVNLEKCILSLNSSNIVGSVDNLDESENSSNRHQTIQCHKLLHLKILCARIKTLSHSMAMHLAKNTEIVPNPHLENGANLFDGFDHQHLSHHDVIQELMKNLVEIYTKKLISKHNLERLKLKINHINSNCKKCVESCMLAVLTTQKVLLVVSLNNNTKDVSSLLKKLIENILQVLPCEDCRVSCGSQTGSETSRIIIPDFNSFNQFVPEPSCSTHGLKEKTSSPDGYDKSRTDRINTSERLQNRPSSSIPSIFLHQTRFESQITTNNDSSTNIKILKSSDCEADPNLNSKTKTGKAAQPSVYYEKRHQRELKVADDGLLRSEMPPCQSQEQSEVKTIHNSSLGFVTPSCRASPNDRCSNSGNSIDSTKTLRIQNNSLPYDAELQRCEVGAHFERKENGKNYSSSIRRKIFREKGLLKVQHKNCKSAEVITDSENESLKHPKAKIQKHSSEPNFLTPKHKSSTERAPNHKEKANEHFYVNVEIQESKRETVKEKGDEKSYWSPFHVSNCNDNPNILDIPNWSAKSSHTMTLTEKDSNQKTMQDRVDVTLRNEGKGYGLSIEFLGSTSEDSTQLPRITAVSSQGAAHKTGILQKGDRVLAINGQDSAEMTIEEFDHLKEEAFSADEVLLSVEFDVAVRDLRYGTFDVCVTKTSKTGLIYNDFSKGAPLVIKGIVKGSPAHRCGSLFPGDEVLYANNIRQEFYDVSKNSYERTEFVIIRVRRQTFKEKFGDEIHLDPVDPSPFKAYDLTRTSIHSNHGSHNMLLEQELALYRDPVTRDFGFLIGQDQDTKMIYVTGIRPGGPAECSKVIRKNDMILQVNGVDLETNKDCPVMSLFQSTGNRLELKTRRILKYL